MASSSTSSADGLWKEIAKRQKNARVGYLEKDEVEEFLGFLMRLRAAIEKCPKIVEIERAGIAGHVGSDNGAQTSAYMSATRFGLDCWEVYRVASVQERLHPASDHPYFPRGGARIELRAKALFSLESLEDLLRRSCGPDQSVEGAGIAGAPAHQRTIRCKKVETPSLSFEVLIRGMPEMPERALMPRAQVESEYPYYLANKPRQPNRTLEVFDKYSRVVAARVALADRDAIEKAITAAVEAEAPMRRFPPYARQAVLEHCMARFRERFDELALALCVEAGKPIKDAEGEVTRLIDTFRVAAEEAVRIDGEVLNLEISQRAQGYRGFVQRVPIGACSFITPFNFPLNLVAHKVAPAIAAGCPFVLKPSEKTPIGALIIGEILAETDLPEGAFSVLPCRVEDADPFVSDERLKLLSFTGGQIGWDLKAKAGRKKVVLELGGNAACIVDEDQRGELQRVIERLIFGAYYQSGQSCIKVQRVFAHASLYEELRERFVAATRALKAGDPKQRDTFLGPLIDEASAKRLEQWVAEARQAGATLLCGGGRDGNRLEATVLENVPIDAKINALEAFGPVTVLAKFDGLDEAIAAINASDYGLQAGIFTNDLAHAMHAWNEIEAGGVIVNDVPSFRVDNMPYGGVKRSGLGREGIRYAIEDMTERRLMVLR